MLNQLVIEIKSPIKSIEAATLHENNVKMALLHADENFIANGRLLTDWGIPISICHAINAEEDAKRQTADTLALMQNSRLPVTAVFPQFDFSKQEISSSDEKISAHAKTIFQEFRAAGCKTIGYTKADFIANHARKSTEWLPFYQWHIGDAPQDAQEQPVSWRQICEYEMKIPSRLPPRLNGNHIIGVQYASEHITLPGIYADEQKEKPASLRVHYFDEVFLQRLGAFPNPQASPAAAAQPAIRQSSNLRGITYFTTRQFGTNCHIIICSMKGMRFHVTPFTRLRTVSETARETGADIVINGDGWGTDGYIPNSIAASDGFVYQTHQQDYNPWVNISQENVVSFDWKNPQNLYNAVSGDRFLIQNGRYNEQITNTTKAPRTSIGTMADGKLVIMVADGRTEHNAGLTFFEAASVFLELGVVHAINLDGGGSSALWFKDRIVNIPIDSGIPGKERAVANHLCIFIDKVSQYAQKADINPQQPGEQVTLPADRLPLKQDVEE